ncbi:dihydroorotate dehydrogenase [Candidatus Gracilibacteria bacterium]|nr:dihydroorotate dehydrogenase [Candidatus Gracilibacteria bacterium]
MQEIYKIDKSYEWNYEHGPTFEGEISARPEIQKKTKLWDFELNSPIGIPAGPLLNSRWIELYGKLGFDIPVYKTVRTVEWKSHPEPNCVYVDMQSQLTEKDVGGEAKVLLHAPKKPEDITITNSFGVPSQAPTVWMPDIGKANNALSDGQVMIVSIMGTPDVGRELPDDYGRCAKMAVEAGAKIIEANYSCPNVCTGEGMLFRDAETSSQISKKIREAIGPSVPFLIKMGLLPPDKLEEVVRTNLPYVDGFAGINTVAMNVRKPDGSPALPPGKERLRTGLCGHAIHSAGSHFTQNLFHIKKKLGADFVICGVGGMMTAEDLHGRLQNGADIVMSATVAMWDPFLAQKFHELINPSSYTRMQ